MLENMMNDWTNSDKKFSKELVNNLINRRHKYNKQIDLTYEHSPKEMKDLVGDFIHSLNVDEGLIKGYLKDFSKNENILWRLCRVYESEFRILMIIYKYVIGEIK